MPPKRPMSKAPAKFRKVVDEPTMSDNTLLLKIEDLIGITFGSIDNNIINFKMLHSILHILARQMRLLEQDVEIRFAEEDDILAQLKEALAPESPDSSPDEDEKGSKKAKKGGKKDKDKPEPENEDTDAKGGDKKKRKKKKVGTDESSSLLHSRKISTAISGGGSSGQGGGVPGQGSRTRVGSIEVVTASQFNLLEKLVQVLLKRTGGVPLPTLPSNEDLLAELTKGTASLSDTMDAMQVNARIKAAEQGLTKMAELLTHLAASGALPPEVADIIAQLQSDLQQIALGEQPEAVLTDVEAPSASVINKASVTTSAVSAMSKISEVISQSGFLTHNEMFEALQVLEEELMRNVALMTSKAGVTVEQANLTVKSVADKMDVAMKLDKRITTLKSVTDDYAEQLSGFDAGLTSQLDAFKEQMSQLRNELNVGLVQLQSAGTNSESAALTDLRAGYESLLEDLEKTMNTHGSLVSLQKQNDADLRLLIDNVEMMREQKADRDEVADGLRDKANISRLKGLLRQRDFDETREDLNYRLTLTYEKFAKQEQVWMLALKDLTDIVSTKASIMDMLGLKDFVAKTLNEHMETLRRLEFLLGEPKTAMMTRQLARDAQCGPCRVPALMEPYDKRSGAPPKLPALLRHPPPDQPCALPTRAPTAEDYRRHVCRRWVGGSHTLLGALGGREPAAPPDDESVAPTRRYTAHGDDGRLYLMEEELQPCVECNKAPPSARDAVALSDDGGGDVACQ